MATTDLHMNLRGHDYHSDRTSRTTGLARIATLIDGARAEARREGALCLLFDNGDGLQGTPMGDIAADSPGQPHPLMQAFAALRYDAIGLGNHDFSFGLKAVASILRQAPCPVVSSNLSDLAGLLPANLAKRTVLERRLRCAGGEMRDIRIGVLSLLPPQTVVWDRDALAGKIEVQDIVDAAEGGVASLKHENCDLVIALAHTGIGAAERVHGMENALLPLARLPGLDAVIAGHTHLPFASAGPDAMLPVPTVLPGSAGSHLGLIDLDLAYSDSGGWSVTDSQAALRSVAKRDPDGRIISAVPENAEIVELVEPSHRATCARMNQIIGSTPDALHTYFTFLAPDRTLAVVAAAQESALRRNLKPEVIAELPLLSAVAPGRFGGRSGPSCYTDIPAGRVRMRNIADMHVFPNTLKAVIISGDGLRDWLDMSACLFNTIIPGSRDMHLLNKKRAGHNFDVIHGVTCQFDLSQPPRFALDGRLVNPASSRVKNLCWRGRPIEAGQRFIVATNSYRAAGGGNFPVFDTATPVELPLLKISDVLREYFAAPDAVTETQPATPPWSFVPMPDTRVIAETGPAARAYLDELGGRGVRELGCSSDGFLRLSLNVAPDR